MGKRLARTRLAWSSARGRAAQTRKQLLEEQARNAVLACGETVPATLLAEVRGERDRAHDTLDRVSDLLARWAGPDAPWSAAQARAELIEALNKRDGRDVRMARLRTRVRVLRLGLSEATKRADKAIEELTAVRAERDGAMTIVNRVLRVPTIRAREDSPDFVEAAALRTALGLKEPEAPRRELPELPQRSRAAG